MATRGTTAVLVGVTAAAVVAGVVAIAFVRSDDDHGRRPNEVIAAEARTGPSATDAAWSLDGSTLYVVDGSGIVILSGSPLARTGRLESHRIEPIATWNKDRSMVAVSSRFTEDAEVWDLANGEALPNIDTGGASAQLAWSPNGKDIVATGAEGIAAIRDARTGRVSSSFTLFQRFVEVSGLAWPTADRIVAVSYNRIITVDAATGEEVWSHYYTPSGLVEPSSDGAKMVIGQGGNNDHAVYSLSDGTELGVVDTATRSLEAVDWSPDGRWLVATGNDDRPQLWDATAAATHKEYPTVAPYAGGGSWAPNSKFVALSDRFDQRVIVIDVTGASQDEELSIAEDVVLTATAWAPSGDRLAAIGRDGTVFVWNVTT